MDYTRNSTHRNNSFLVKILVVLVVGILFYIFNYYTPLFADDYSYSYSFATGERIETVADILYSQIAHYNNTNGRFVTHFFAQLFLLMGKPTFNFINIGIFLSLGVLICFHAKGAFSRISASELIVAYTILFLSTPAFGQSFLWLDGSATYSFGIVIALSYLIPFRKMIDRVQRGEYVQKSTISQIVAFGYTFALGVLAGNTSENVGAAIIVYTLLCGIYAKLHKVKLEIWMLGLGNIVGTILAVVSPGTQDRLDGAGGISCLGILKNIIYIGADFVEYLQLPLCILVVLMAAYFLCKSRSIKECFADCAIFIIYFVSMLAAAFSMILSPQFPERAWSIVIVLATVSIISSLDAVSNKIAKAKRIRMLIAVLLCVLSIGPYINGYFRLKAIYVFHQTRVETIISATKEGKQSVELQAIASDCPHSVFDPFGDLNEDSSKWPNTAIARYYGIDEIVRADNDFDY